MMYGKYWSRKKAKKKDFSNHNHKIKGFRPIFYFVKSKKGGDFFFKSLYDWLNNHEKWKCLILFFDHQQQLKASCWCEVTALMGVTL